jgi:hypothetical protein
VTPLRKKGERPTPEDVCVAIWASIAVAGRAEVGGATLALTLFKAATFCSEGVQETKQGATKKTKARNKKGKSKELLFARDSAIDQE